MDSGTTLYKNKLSALGPNALERKDQDFACQSPKAEVGTVWTIAAITKQLWKVLGAYCEVVDDTGNKHPLHEFVKNDQEAGAAITCGISFANGLSRRVVTDDLPGISIATAQQP